MQNCFIRCIGLLLAAVVVITLCLTDTNAQTRRKRRARRVARPVITNPVIAPAGAEQNPGEDKIISTAGEGATGGASPGAVKGGTGQDQIQDTINSLSQQVNKLTEKLGQMQDEQRTLLDMERLTRAEQRAETLRAQLRDVEEKQADLQARLEQTEYALKPENIERAVAVYGSTRPEEVRESRRRQLENERTRIQSQLTTMETSRQRLESAIANADQEVDLLRERVEKFNKAPVQTVTTNDTTAPPNEPPPAKDPYPPQ